MTESDSGGGPAQPASERAAALVKRSDESLAQRFDRLSRHRIIPVLGWLIAIGLAIYTYIAGDHKPALTYFVHPARAAVVRSGQSSQLEVAFAGKHLTGDVTAAQIAFWNDGSRTIRKDDILKPMRIFTRPSVPILEARVRKTSRDVVHVDIDQSHAANGEISLQWNLLEHNDGGVVQLIFAGGESVAILATATIEGQAQVVGQTYSRHDDSPEEAYNRASSSRWSNILLLVFISGQGIISANSIFKAVRKRKWPDTVFSAFVVALSIFMFVRIIKDWAPTPPFGF